MMQIKAGVNPDVILSRYGSKGSESKDKGAVNVDSVLKDKHFGRRGTLRAELLENQLKKSHTFVEAKGPTGFTLISKPTKGWPVIKSSDIAFTV